MRPHAPGVTAVVLAKAPVPGRVKTRLARSIGDEAAAAVAAAALLDTIEACVAAFGAGRCRLALDGEIDDAVGAEDLSRSLRRWTVVEQCAGSLGQRIAHALGGVDGPVVQIGMDTPQASPGLLRDVAGELEEHAAVLGPATDGGWWVLGLRDGARASAIAEVPMSTPTTWADTRAALAGSGLRVAAAPALRDIDELDDLLAVAMEAPDLRFAACARASTP